MRVGFMGSHGTGKTSVAVELAEVTGYRLVTSASRSVHALGYDINQDASVVSQAATSMSRLARQLDAGGDFVSDRTLLDSMAYNEYQLENLWQGDKKAEFWYRTMDVITRHVMHDYDRLVYFPITFPLVADGVRATEQEYQRDIDLRIRRFIDAYGLNVYTINEGSVSERVQEVKELM